MNFLIKLSRNTKVMIPLVIIVGVMIFVGGAAINKQQKVARQSETNQPTTAEPQPVAQTPATETPTEVTPEETETPVDEGATTEPGQVTVEPMVTQNDDGTYTIVASVGTKEAGVCTTTIQETEFTAVATDGMCEFKDLSVPVNAEDLQIEFTADQSGHTGSTRIE
jgi:hypothetical protein